MPIIEKSGGKKRLMPVAVANKTLFFFVLLTIFFVPLLPSSYYHLAYSILFTIIFAAGIVLVSNNKNIIMAFAILAIVMVWISTAVDIEAFKGVSKVINIVIFIFIVYDLVKQVSLAKKVTPKVILESVNGYLLIGMVFSLLVALLMSINPESFSFNKLHSGTTPASFSFDQYLYFAFITLTTTGYGDVVPLTSIARSMSTMISLTGQLYIAVVIALLVGKYISQKGNHTIN